MGAIRRVIDIRRVLIEGCYYKGDIRRVTDIRRVLLKRC